MSASMAAAVPSLDPERRRALPDPADDLFKGLVVSNPQHARRTGVVWPVSIVGHLLAAAALILVPLLWPEASPQTTDYIRALIYNPPPPPPPPLPKGAALLEKQQPAKPVTPETEPEKPKFTAQLLPEEKPLEKEARERDTEQVGSETGSDVGVPEGMDIGVEGGVVGGLPGGILGGVIGGTGDGPVMDFDQAPRPIKMGRPQYPPEAFVKKIEGTVEVEILIDSTGRVVRATVVRSIPLLDAAALQTVRQWIFSPAIKNGRPVATIANAPVTFRIF